LPPEKECPDWRDWRRERNCRQTLSAAFSITYEPHKLQWMLTGESQTSLEVTACGLAARRLVHSQPLQERLSDGKIIHFR
jgi:hypothetical protein